ncbi:MAG: TMEM143 family protein [Hyphomicrobiaceae bacterium]|nr:TMEM143 family protein [Hyphomicrobiaceae bacterium]
MSAKVDTGPGSVAAATLAHGREAAGRHGARHGVVPPSTQVAIPMAPLEGADILRPDSERGRERFIPVTRFALMDRLTAREAWAPGEAKAARRFFHYLDYWRHQRYGKKLLELEQIYEPFSPDSDLLMTRKFAPEELVSLQSRMISEIAGILEQANYERVDTRIITDELATQTHYGLDLKVDFALFEECLVYYRGASTRKDQRRVWRKFLRKEEFDVPIFQRLFLLFKLKTLEKRADEFLVSEKITRKEALKLAKRERAHLPAAVTPANIYLKLFKNIPRSDVEMVFPNTVVKFRLLDKIKLGVTGAGGIGMSTAAAAGKVALLFTNPIIAAGAAVGIGATLFRQAMNFVNTKQRYMVIMAQNLYFHSMADNRGVMIKLIDRAAEEDVKEEILLYSVLAKERAHVSELKAIDMAVEQYLFTTFGIEVDFDLEDALQRLKADGLVRVDANGYLETLPPAAAAAHLDKMWDTFLDELPDIELAVGEEIDAPAPAAAPAGPMLPTSSPPSAGAAA